MSDNKFVLTLTAFIAIYYNSLVKWCEIKFGKAFALDLVDEALVKYDEEVKKGKEFRKPKAYVITIIKSIHNDVWRNKQSEEKYRSSLKRPGKINQKPDLDEEPYNDTEDRIESISSMKALYLCIDKLDAKAKVVIQYLLEGKAKYEIMSILKIDESEYKRRKQRALYAFHQELVEKKEYRKRNHLDYI